MIPGRASWNDNDLIKQLVRENGALSVGHVHGHQRAARVRGRRRRPPGRRLPQRPRGREPRCRHRRLGRRVPAATSRGTAARRAPARSSCATAGAPGSATTATSGSPTTTGRSPATRASAATAAAPPTRGGRAPTTTRGIYQYDELGVTDHWGYDGPRRLGRGQRFTATTTQAISAAGFYTLSSGTRYQVWAGPTLEDAHPPRVGPSASCPATGRSSSRQPLQVTEGRRFVVAIRLYSPDDDHPLAIERPARSWMRGAAATRGQSFMQPRRDKTWIGRRPACARTPVSASRPSRSDGEEGRAGVSAARPFRLRAVLFDFDGTLTHPGALDFAAIKREVGCPPDQFVLEWILALPHGAERDAAALAARALRARRRRRLGAERGRRGDRPPAQAGRPRRRRAHAQRAAAPSSARCAASRHLTAGRLRRRRDPRRRRRAQAGAGRRAARRRG